MARQSATVSDPTMSSFLDLGVPARLDDVLGALSIAVDVTRHESEDRRTVVAAQRGHQLLLGVAFLVHVLPPPTRGGPAAGASGRTTSGRCWGVRPARR